MDKDLRTKLAEGYIHARSILEVVGKPKEHVTKSLKSHVTKIKDKYSLLKQSIEPPVKQENFFNAFAEIEILVKQPIDLLTFCFDFMPASIEILAPEKIIISNNDFSGFLNDLQARQHALNKGIVELKQQNVHYVKNTAVLLRNFLIVMLSSKPLTLEQVQPYLGVKKEDISKVLDVLIKEGQVKKQGNLYKVILKK